MKSLVEAKQLETRGNQDNSKLPRLPVTNMSKLQLTVLMKLLRSIILHAVIVKYCIVSLMSGGMNVLCVKNGMW